MADDPEPPRKFYGLKPTEFERVNAPLTSPPPPGAPPTGAEAGRPIDVRDLLRQASPPATRSKAPTATSATSDVHALLRDNLSRADAAGLNDVAPVRKRRSRRQRDYFMVLLLIDAFFAFWAFGPYANSMTFVYGIAGLIMFTLGLTWVMWFVMDDY